LKYNIVYLIRIGLRLSRSARELCEVSALQHAHATPVNLKPKSRRNSPLVLRSSVFENTIWLIDARSQRQRRTIWSTINISRTTTATISRPAVRSNDDSLVGAFYLCSGKLKRQQSDASCCTSATGLRASRPQHNEQLGGRPVTLRSHRMRWRQSGTKACAENYNKWHDRFFLLKCKHHFGNFKPLQFPSAVR